MRVKDVMRKISDVIFLVLCVIIVGYYLFGNAFCGQMIVGEYRFLYRVSFVVASVLYLFS